MTFEPNLPVKEGLDHLAKCLDPLIALKPATDLAGITDVELEVAVLQTFARQHHRTKRLVGLARVKGTGLSNPMVTAATPLRATPT